MYHVLFLFTVKTPSTAMYSIRNSISSAVWFGNNRASGHPELLSTDTNKYFLIFCIRNGPANSRFTSGRFPDSFLCILGFLLFGVPHNDEAFRRFHDVLFAIIRLMRLVALVSRVLCAQSELFKVHFLASSKN